MKYADVTLDQIRMAIIAMSSHARAAMDNGAYSLAQCLQDKVESLWIELVQRIQLDDPETTEADIRYFESITLSMLTLE